MGLRQFSILTQLEFKGDVVDLVDVGAGLLRLQYGPHHHPIEDHAVARMQLQYSLPPLVFKTASLIVLLEIDLKWGGAQSTELYLSVALSP